MAPNTRHIERKDDEDMIVVPVKADGEEDVAMEGVKKAEEVDPAAATISDIKNIFPLLDRAVSLFDSRFTLRALRSISTIRKRLTREIIISVITDTFNTVSSTASLATEILKTLESDNGLQELSSDVDMDESKKSKKDNKESKDIIPEVAIYIAILTQVLLLDNKKYETGAIFSTKLAGTIRTYNRRTLDSLAAKVYFYLSLFHEQLDPKPPSSRSPVVPLRPLLLNALRTAVLRNDDETQAAIIVLMLRNYLQTSHIDQADLLIAHTQFPEHVSNSQVARFLYYLGRMRATQLRYTEAFEHLTAASRKAPSSQCAAGFAQAVTKLLLVVELLMGDIPDRAVFRQPAHELVLEPYFQLVQAVRVGNLEDFEKSLMVHGDLFQKDNTYSLIVRLRQNVIKTGIRMLSLSYSRISLRDICIRLQLGSEESAEYIVAKAIRDGVIEATLDREHGFMKSKDVGDVYSTREPADAFHDRIRACLALHDESVKAMRFPMNQHRLELKNAQEAREKEREMAEDIQNGDLDDDDLGGEFDV